MVKWQAHTVRPSDSTLAVTQNITMCSIDLFNLMFVDIFNIKSQCFFFSRDQP